jgi:hypothetical protein
MSKTTIRTLFIILILVILGTLVYKYTIKDNNSSDMSTTNSDNSNINASDTSNRVNGSSGIDATVNLNN